MNTKQMAGMREGSIALAQVLAAVLLLFAASQGAAQEQVSANASAADLDSFCDRLPRPAFAKLSKSQFSNDWFEVYEIEKGIWAIYEPFQWQEVISYLIVGDNMALLFDTGNGIGNIKAVIKKITAMPVIVINSHSHFDHIGGNYQFDNIASIATPFTIKNAKGSISARVKREVSAAALCRPLPEGITRDNHHIRPFHISRIISEGDIFDLGGRKLELLRTPGHTEDSVALLDRDAGFLWSGDSFYEGPVWLFFPETDLYAYRQSMARLARLAPRLKAVFPAHNTPRADPALLIQASKNLELVLAGKVAGVGVMDGNVEFRFDRYSFLMRKDYHRLPPP